MFTWNPQAKFVSREEQLARNPRVYTALEKHEVYEWPVVIYSEFRGNGMSVCADSTQANQGDRPSRVRHDGARYPMVPCKIDSPCMQR